MLPPEKRMGKAPPDDVDSNWFGVVIAKETHEYQARALPPEKMLRSVILGTGKVTKFSQIAHRQSIDKCPPLLILILIGLISDLGSHLIWSNVHHVV